MIRRHAPFEPRRLAAALLAMALLVHVSGPVVAASSTATPLGDLQVHLEPVARGFEQPVLLVGAGDGSGDRYVVEQRGSIWRLEPDESIAESPLLDISGQVHYQHERGMLGLAFHPRFEDNGRFFVAYTRGGDSATVLSEFRVPEAAGEPPEASERTLLVLAQPSHFHKGGMLEFDDAGRLLFGVGDGGSLEDAALDTTSLLGKLLRLDVDAGRPYGLPPDNGFAGVPGARPEVHAIGLRNPWRFSIDRATGALYIGDVGDGAWEEIDVLPRDAAGASFGWSEMEGPECVAGRPCDPGDHLAPALVYAHVDAAAAHCAVVGGYVYRGSAGSLPVGLYLFADHCSRTIWGAPADELAAGIASRAVIGRLDASYGQPLSFGQDDAGELYLTTDDGHILHIVSEAYSAASRRNTAGRMPPLR